MSLSIKTKKKYNDFCACKIWRKNAVSIGMPEYVQKGNNLFIENQYHLLKSHRIRYSLKLHKKALFNIPHEVNLKRSQ